MSSDPAYVGRDLYRRELEQAGLVGIDNAKISDDGGEAALVIGQSALSRGLPAVLNRIQIKEADVPRCRAQLPGVELWLLVVATESFAGWVATDDVRRADKIRSGFDRVFFMDAHGAQAEAWELGFVAPRPSID